MKKKFLFFMFLFVFAISEITLTAATNKKTTPSLTMQLPDDIYVGVYATINEPPRTIRNPWQKPDFVDPNNMSAPKYLGKSYTAEELGIKNFIINGKIIPATNYTFSYFFIKKATNGNPVNLQIPVELGLSGISMPGTITITATTDTNNNNNISNNNNDDLFLSTPVYITIPNPKEIFPLLGVNQFVVDVLNDGNVNYTKTTVKTKTGGTVDALRFKTYPVRINSNSFQLVTTKKSLKN